MSELFGEGAKHIQKSNVMKDEFGWEIPVEMVPIPSRGLLYSPDSVLYKKDAVMIKAMTAKEEDILTSQGLLKEGTVISHLLQSCITEDNIDVDDMIIGDRNAILTAIRITGYGPDYNIKSSCSNCGKTNDLTIDLGALPIKRLSIEPVEQGRNLFEFDLPVTKKKVLFRYPTYRQGKQSEQKRINMKKHFKSPVDDVITSSLELSIHSIDNITDRNKIHHFIMNMPANDSRMLRGFMSDNQPGMDMDHEFTCEHCSHENKIAIPITTNFFWPGT